MKFLFTALISIFVISIQVSAQISIERQSFSSHGTTAHSGDIYSHNTVGQNFVGDVTTGDNLKVSPGFEQTYLITTDQSDHSISELSVFPNPTLDLVIVKSKAALTTYTLRDQHGQVVSSKKINDKNDLQISMAHLPSGTYHLILNSNDNNSNFTIIKQ